MGKQAPIIGSGWNAGGKRWLVLEMDSVNHYTVITTDRMYVTHFTAAQIKQRRDDERVNVYLKDGFATFDKADALLAELAKEK